VHIILVKIIQTMHAPSFYFKFTMVFIIFQMNTLIGILSEDVED
jgi:hypothetical protein